MQVVGQAEPHSLMQGGHSNTRHLLDHDFVQIYARHPEKDRDGVSSAPGQYGFEKEMTSDMLVLRRETANAEVHDHFLSALRERQSADNSSLLGFDMPLQVR